MNFVIFAAGGKLLCGLISFLIEISIFEKKYELKSLTLITFDKHFELSLCRNILIFLLIMSMQTSVLMTIASGLVYESKQAISQSLFTGSRISRCMCVCVFPIPSHLVVRVLRLEGEGAELHVPLRVGVGVRAPREVAAAHVHAPDVVLETRGREVGAAGWNIPYKKRVYQGDFK